MPINWWMHEQNGVHPHNDYYLVIKKGWALFHSLLQLSFSPLRHCLNVSLPPDSVEISRVFVLTVSAYAPWHTMALRGSPQLAVFASTWDRVSLFLLLACRFRRTLWSPPPVSLKQRWDERGRTDAHYLYTGSGDSNSDPHACTQMPFADLVKVVFCFWDRVSLCRSGWCGTY